MNREELSRRKCVPCEGGVPPLSPERIEDLLAVVEGWEARDGKLVKGFRFPDFRGAMAFLNRVAEVAEAEGHHPDFCVHYNRVDFTVWTHAIDGISENDFVLAAKIDELAR
jgi:4a-hydroxytetrahydrobiopterin dehydratase